MKSTQEIVMSYARHIEELEEKASALAAENEALKKMLQLQWMQLKRLS